MTHRRPVVSLLVSAALSFSGILAIAGPAAAGDPLTDIKINEVESNGGTPGDWVELRNNSGTGTDVGGLKFKDGDDAHAFYEIPAGTSIPAGGFLVLDEAQFGFGLGGADSARLFLNDGTTSVDSYTWAVHATATYGRCPNGTGVFGQTSSTKNTANDCPPIGLAAIKLNEVESNGDPVGDWAELKNLSADPVDVSGLKFRDGDAAHAYYAIPAGTTIPGNGYLALDEAQFGFGLGGADSVNLVQPDETTVVDTYTWATHAVTSYGRCPDGTGAFTTTGQPTKAATNNCAPLVRINEIESDGGSPADWIELYNYGATAADVSGLVVKDSVDANAYPIPAGTSIASGGYLVLEQSALGFELDAADSARLFASNGTTLYDSYEWAAPAVATTYGRCPNGTGAFATTQIVTKGALNNCPGDLITEPWPGGTAATSVDVGGQLGGDISGLTYDKSGSATPGVLWAVDNGSGSLLRLLWNGTQWVSDTANGWSSSGKSLKYADGTGVPDTEGVSVGGTSSAAGLYTATERNNQANGVSRIAILRYDVSGTSTTLTATNEWTLTGDLPAVSPNLGIETVVWVPDSHLVASGFKDESTAAVYNPAGYANHGNGLFLVGLEGDGRVYAYALDHTSSSFTRVASFASGFTGVMGLDWEEEKDRLWVVCDDTCSGRHATFAVDTAAGPTQGTFTAQKYYERPTGMPNLNNEGFTTTPRSECVSGLKPVYWADDAATGTNALRAGTLSCTPRVAQTVSFTTPKPTSVVVGDTYAAAATGGASGNPLVLGIAAGSASVCSITGATVRFDHSGTCEVQATQAGNDDYAPGSASQSIAVARVLSDVSVTVKPNTVSATVTPRSTGAGTPAGTVQFSVDGTVVGSAPLTGGTATLAHTVATGGDRTVLATYQGSPDHAVASGSTVRRDPTLTVTLLPGGPLSTSGWYTDPVQVLFSCSTSGSPLLTPCSAAVTLASSAADQSVTRSITAEDGGSATVSTGPLDLDLDAPSLKVAGVRDGAIYASAPKPWCRVKDPVSGLAACTIKVKKTGARTYKVVAKAVDVAGNRAKAVETYRLAP